MNRRLKRLLCSLLAVCLFAGSMKLPDVRAGQDGEDMIRQSDREKPGLESGYRSGRCGDGGGFV